MLNRSVFEQVVGSVINKEGKCFAWTRVVVLELLPPYQKMNELCTADTLFYWELQKNLCAIWKQVIPEENVSKMQGYEVTIGDKYVCICAYCSLREFRQ